MNFISHNTKKYEVIIPISEQDILNIEKNLPNIIQYLPVKKIVVIGTKAISSKFTSPEITFVDEDTVVPGMTFERIKEIIYSIYPKAERRAGWYFQQFLKLGYAYKCESEYYLSWDSDTIPLTPISFFNEENRPVLHYISEKNGDDAYFKLIKELWPDNSVVKKKKISCITEHMFFCTELVKNMLTELNNNESLNGNNFYEKILITIDKKHLNLSGFSEFETYATYVDNKYPNHYYYKRWRNLRNGKFYLGFTPNQKILSWVSRSFESVSIERYDRQFILFKLFINHFNIYKLIPFSIIYRLSNPLYSFYYWIRLGFRSIIKS